MTTEPTIDITSELNRKALEQLERIHNDREQGVISDNEARHSLATLFGTVSGLCSQDVFDMISESSHEMNASAPKPTVMQRTLVSEKGAIVQLEYAFGEGHVLVKTRMPSETQAGWTKVAKQSFDEAVIPFEAAKERMAAYEASLIRQGYKELM